MLFSVAVNFTGGILIEKYQTRKKKILVATLLINLGLLGYFKYFGTLTEAITGLFFSRWNRNHSFSGGASDRNFFYTFQALSYVIDVYRGEVPAQHNFWHMLLYISFFPQLILRTYCKISRHCSSDYRKKETTRKFAAGIMRFCWGLGKKVLLANSFARVVDEIFKYGPYAVSRKALWLGAILYMMQIYYDFPDIPIWPLVLEKCSDLNSRRISIILIQLVLCRNSGTDGIFPVFLVSRLCLYSFGRKSQRRGMHLSKPAYRIFLTGMWHGAGIAFILWGLYHGLFLNWNVCGLEKTGKTAWNCGLGLHGDRGVFWMDSVPCRKYFPVFTYVRNMFVAHGGTILLSAYLDSKMIFLIVMGVLFAGVLQKRYEKVRVHSDGKIPANGMVTVPRMIACLVIFWLSVAALVNNSYNPFIYFRF